MFPSIRDGLDYCVADGRTVFLDLEADRYFCLPIEIDDAFQAWVAAGCKPHLPDETHTALSAAGIIEQTERWATKRPCRSTTPSKSIRSERAERPEFGTVAEVVASEFVCRWATRSGRLSYVIRKVRAERETKPRHPRNDADIETCARHFQDSLLFVASKDRCLSRSLALVRYLFRRGHQADLVLGVRMMPFRAHAWVQFGETLLIDTLENVLPYTPILVI